MKNNIYVDNVLTGCDTEEEFYYQSRDLMAKFNLRSWSTNSQRFKEVTNQDNTCDLNMTVGLLGLRWNTTDLLQEISVPLINLTPLLLKGMFCSHRHKSLIPWDGLHLLQSRPKF